MSLGVYLSHYLGSVTLVLGREHQDLEERTDSFQEQLQVGPAVHLDLGLVVPLADDHVHQHFVQADDEGLLVAHVSLADEDLFALEVSQVLVALLPEDVLELAEHLEGAVLTLDVALELGLLELLLLPGLLQTVVVVVQVVGLDSRLLLFGPVDR